MGQEFRPQEVVVNCALEAAISRPGCEPVRVNLYDLVVFADLQEGFRRIEAGRAAVKFWDRDAFHLPGYYTIPRGENHGTPAEGWLEAWGQREGQTFQQAVLWAARNLPPAPPAIAPALRASGLKQVLVPVEKTMGTSCPSPVEFIERVLRGKSPMAVAKEELARLRAEGKAPKKSDPVVSPVKAKADGRKKHWTYKRRLAHAEAMRAAASRRRARLSDEIRAKKAVRRG